MKDLCIDTSAGAVVAVVTEAATTVNTEPNSRAHAERLAELISLSISEAGLGKTTKEADRLHSRGFAPAS